MSKQMKKLDKHIVVIAIAGGIVIFLARNWQNAQFGIDQEAVDNGLI